MPKTKVTADGIIRRCSRCDKWFPIEQFSINNSDPLGHTYLCRPCAREVGRRNRERNKAELLRNPDDKRHGTHTGYDYGCRCDRCQDVGRRRARERLRLSRERKRRAKC